VSSRAAGQNHDDDHVEALLVWGERGPVPEVDGWLRERGLQTLPMAAGLLVTGTVRQFASVFGIDPGRGQRAVEVPVPPELRDGVASITIPPAPRVY
jgi:hypothetical protein